MKKILKYSLLAVLTLAALAGCKKSELDTDQFNGFSLAAVAPNPVMRGGELRLVGGGLENATAVQFAGNITVTDIQVVKSGAQSEIRVLVPLEGPEVGKVTVVSSDGAAASTRFDLTFTEPIEIESYTPAEVLSGDVITFKGEYLNDVKEVIFTGDDAFATEFVSQSRHELQVKVPYNAISGPVILSDVNEKEDDSTIPNHIYTKTDLAVANPTVDKAEKATYKSGDMITVTGAHLDMIKTVSLVQADDVEFLLSEDGQTITFTLPAEATDGAITLTSFAGVAFDAGEIATVTVSDLAIKSLAEDERYKAGCEVEISGEDLDLVTKVVFAGSDEGSWYLSEGKIYAIQPVDAQDGAVTLTLESGKTAKTEAIEVVKPDILAWEHFDEYVAGETVVKVEGLDLDLVESVKMGDKKQGFIDCDYEMEDDELGNAIVKVTIPEQAYTGPIIFTSAAGYETETFAIEVTYDMAVSINFKAPSFELGSEPISITGKKLLQIESVAIKGKKVTSYSVRSDDAMTFELPEGVGPGVYRLALTLTDGTELTWPVPFAITAPFDEIFVFEGYEDLNGWKNQPYLGADGAFAEAGMVVGDQVRIYYKPLADWWQFQIFGGHWEGMTFPEVGGTNTVSANNTEPDAEFFTFEVTSDNIGILTGIGGWGGALLTQGEGVAITGLSLIHFRSGGKTIWEGSHAINWGGSDEDHKCVKALAYGGFDWSTVKAGTTLQLKFERTADEVQIRLGNGSWVALPGTTDPYKPEGSSLEVELTADMLAEMVSNGGLVITGQGYTLKEVVLM